MNKNPLNSVTDGMPKTPSLLDAIYVWAKIGMLSFGGPAAQISLMHRILVDECKWLSEKQYLNALSFCMLLPGPEAMQLATYSGWRLHGFLGGLIAGLLFVIPGALIVLALAMTYAYFGSTPFIAVLFLGIKAAVLVIVVEALLRVARRALNGSIYWGIAVLAFVGIFFLSLPFPLIIFSAALFGFFIRPDVTRDSTLSEKVSKPWLQFFLTLCLWLFIWVLPFLILFAFSGPPILAEIGQFFSRLAVVTFGGAYTVLAYMGQAVVDQFGWLSAGEMMDGLGLAETTPGPLILVNEFVGFLAAFREGGFWLGMAGALIALWCTFIPCFLWIFLGAPHLEWICSQPRLKGALSAISAAVVGVIFNLSVWFALHVLFRQVSLEKIGILTIWQPQFASIDWKISVLSIICALLLFKYHQSIIRVLIVAALFGWLLNLVGL